MTSITLYGTPLSLYTGKARSYLIKAVLAYEEISVASKRYSNTVKPVAGTASIPVIETEDGSVIRDGTKIIDFYEAKSGGEFSPTTPKQRVLSRLFDVIGSEGLLRPAMHYRWNFPEMNAEFVQFHFEANIPPGPDRSAFAAKVMDRMRNAGELFGAVADNFPMIEGLYEELLQKLNAHFAEQPYLLGTKPSIGDFGLMAPMYAHLGRDPKPMSMMQANAIRVFRWVERMNRTDSDMGEMTDRVSNEYLVNDEVPQTMIDLLSHFAIDFLPETTAAAKSINSWLDEHKPEVGSKVPRAVGLCEFEVRGQTVNAMAQPYRFYLLKRVQDEFEQMSENDQADVQAMLTSCGLQDILNIKLSREIAWQENLEIWN